MKSRSLIPGKQQQQPAVTKKAKPVQSGFEDHRTAVLAQGKLRESIQKHASNEPLIQLRAVMQFGTKQESFLSGEHRGAESGLPTQLKSGIENLSGYSMDDVKVHYNSSKPAQLKAHAYAQGSEIHLAPGQEKHLPHEAWHVVQQKQGRVRPTRQLKSKVGLNDDVGLEREADVMGAKAKNMGAAVKQNSPDPLLRNPGTSPLNSHPVQRYVQDNFEAEETIRPLFYTHKLIKPYARGWKYKRDLDFDLSGEFAWLDSLDLSEEQMTALQDLDSEMAQNQSPHEIWSQLDEEESRETFAKEAIARVLQPENINQGKTETCGVASVLYLNASRKPVEYIQKLTDIYFRGKLNGKDIAGAQANYEKYGKDSELPLTDWLYIVPFRHSQNYMYHFHGETVWRRAFTTPWAVAKWMKTELGAGDVKNHFFPRGGAWKALISMADDLEDPQTLAVMLLDGNRLGANKKELKEAGMSKPNHFVVLEGLKVNDEGDEPIAHLDVYTWGGRYNIPVAQSEVEKLIWVMTTGKFPEDEN